MVGVVVGVLLASLVGTADQNLGGVYNNVEQYFDGGIDLTGDGDIEVDNTTVIDASGNVDAPITSTTGTFSSTLGVTGELTSREGTTALTASTTITADDSGKTFYAGTADVQVTLPVPADGVWYRFTVSGNFATTNMVVQGPAAGASDDVIFGSLEVAGAVVLCASEDTISFVNSAELKGDWIELHSDGTNWYISGQGGTSGSITCTDAD